MRVATTASTLSGSASSSGAPEEATSSCRKSGLPPARPAIAATSCWSRPCGRGRADQLLRGLLVERLELDRHRRDRRHAVRRREAALDRPPRRAQRATACVETWPPRWRSSSAEASSIQCTSSITSSVGPSSSFASTDSTTPCSRARRKAGWSSSTSCVGSTCTSSGSATSGSHGTSSGSSSVDALAQRVRGGAVLRQLEQRAQQPAEGEVRRRRLVLRARGRHGEQVGRLRLQLLDEPRLAHAGLADQLDDVAEAHPHGRERGREDRQLALAADERQPRARARLAAEPETPTDVERRHRLGDPLQRQRLELDRLEGAARALEQVAGGQHLARLRPCPSGARRGRPSCRGSCRCAGTGAPTSPAKTRPRAVPMPQRQLGREIGDPARGAQDALLVLARGLGRAGDAG